MVIDGIPRYYTLLFFWFNGIPVDEGKRLIIPGFE
jgi:hypothetical protein